MCGFLGEAIGVGPVAGRRESGVLLVTVGSARAAEGRRTRRLASRSSELAVIASFRGRRDRPGGDSRAGRGLLGAVVEAIGG